MSLSDKGPEGSTHYTGGDVEKNGDYQENQVAGLNTHGERPLQRQLKSRHIQMISIGGVIGTGLFLGTANGLRNGGPLGLLLGYATMGSITFSIMVCLGEMIAHLPIPGGHISLAQRFVNPGFSVTMGWNYWYNWTIVLPAELSAAAVLIGYWAKDINPAAWIAICLVVAVAINCGGTRVYGEMEFWFAIIKVLTIVGLIFLGIILDTWKRPTLDNPEPSRIGFRYWRNPGVFAQYLDIPGAKGRFLGFWAVLIQASFSFIGTEIVAIAAGEAKNPKKNLPKAIKRVYVRILLFYIMGTFIIGLLVSYKNPSLVLNSGTAKSPFVIAISQAGIKALPSIINACLLTSAWSAASSDLYTSSRALYGLALNGNAPKFLTKTTSWGLPWVCVLVGFFFSLLSFMAAGSTSAGTVFNYFANMTSVCGLLTWCGIAYTYTRFYKGLKVQGIDRNTLTYKAPLQPYLTYYSLVMLFLVLFFNGFSVFIKSGGNLDAEGVYHFDTSTFVTSYFPIWFAPLIYIAYNLWKKSWSMIAPEDMDFVSGSRVDEEEVEKPPKGVVGKVWAWLM